jgi:hypothetical protein
MITSGRRRDNFPFPAIAGSYVTGFVLTVLAIVVSAWLGRRVRAGRKGRAFSILLTVAVVAGTLATMSGWEVSYSTAYPEEPQPIAQFLQHADGNLIANICPYSSDGKLLSGVLLFDQDGRPIVNTADSLTDGRPVQPSLPAIANAYPRSLSVPQVFVSVPEDPTGQTVEQQTTTPLSCPSSIGAPAKPAASAPAAPAPSPGG